MLIRIQYNITLKQLLVSKFTGNKKESNISRFRRLLIKIYAVSYSTNSHAKGYNLTPFQCPEHQACQKVPKPARHWGYTVCVGRAQYYHQNHLHGKYINKLYNLDHFPNSTTTKTYINLVLLGFTILIIGYSQHLSSPIKYKKKYNINANCKHKQFIIINFFWKGKVFLQTRVVLAFNDPRNNLIHIHSMKLP